MSAFTLSVFEMYLVIFALSVLSTATLLPLFIYVCLFGAISLYCGVLLISTQIVLLTTCIEYMNFIRFLLYPFRWLAMVQLFYFFAMIGVTKRSEYNTMYKNVSSYASLTDLLTDHNSKNLSSLQRKARKKMLKTVPKRIKHLKENDNLEIKTVSANHVKYVYFELINEHLNNMATHKEKSVIRQYMETLRRYFVMFFSVGHIDEFYLKGELIAYHYCSAVNNAYYSVQWYSSPKAKRCMVYFESIRMALKRAIADPHIVYYNAMPTARNLGSLRAKLEAGLIALDENSDVTQIWKSFGCQGASNSLCAGLRLQSLDRKYWNDIKDESDD